MYGELKHDTRNKKYIKYNSKLEKSVKIYQNLKRQLSKEKKLTNNKIKNESSFFPPGHGPININIEVLWNKSWYRVRHRERCIYKVCKSDQRKVKTFGKIKDNDFTIYDYHYQKGLKNNKNVNFLF